MQSSDQSDSGPCCSYRNHFVGLFTILQQQQQQEKWAKWLETNLIEPLLVKFIKTTQDIINTKYCFYKINYAVIFIRFKNYKYVYVCVYMYKCMYTWMLCPGRPQEGVWSPRAGVTAAMRQPMVGSGSQTWVLRKSSAFS